MKMRKLKIFNIGWVAAFGNWHDVVNRWRKWVRILIPEIHRLAADSANGLCCKNFLAAFFVRTSVAWAVVDSLITSGHYFVQIEPLPWY